MFMLPELFQVSVMQIKKDYGLAWMWILLLQVTQMYNKLFVNITVMVFIFIFEKILRNFLHGIIKYFQNISFLNM